MQKRGKQKFQVFVLVLCIVWCIPLALGNRAAPASLEAVLHPAIVQLWAVSLVIGAILALIGPRYDKVPTGLIVEEVGLAMAGLPSVIYAIILVQQAGVERGGIASAFILGFGIAALGRYWEIFRYLKKLEEIMDKDKAEK